MITYRTNVPCPCCGKLLRTTDLEGYEYLCEFCDENFYGMEVRKPDLVEVSVFCSKDIYAARTYELQKTFKPDFLGYDEEIGCIDIGWDKNNVPKMHDIAEKVRLVIKKIQ